MATQSIKQPGGFNLLKEPSDRTLVVVFGLIAVAFFLASLRLVSDDVFIYDLVGQAIYQKGLLPFTHVFDHKPVVTYYLFGLFALFPPDDAPKYQIISVIGFALSALLTRSFARKEGWWVHFLVIVGLSIHFLRFTANTELFFSPLALVSILLVLRGRGLFSQAAAGVFAALAFNMNYLAVFSIGPAVLYAFWSAPASAGRRGAGLLVYTVGFILAFAAVLAPLWLQPGHLVADYFATQQRFMSGYKSQDGRPFLFFMLGVLPMLALAAVSLPCAEADRRSRNTVLVCFCFAFLASLSSGKYFAYYVYPLVLPLTILWSLSTWRHKRLAALLAILYLALLSAPLYLKDLREPPAPPGATDPQKYSRLKALVGDEPVLSIRAHHSIVYLAHTEPAQPLLWPNHAYLLWGSREDDYFVGHLARQPKFVLLKAGLCEERQVALPQACRLVAADYQPVLQIEDRDPVRRATLYQRRNP